MRQSVVAVMLLLSAFTISNAHQAIAQNKPKTEKATATGHRNVKVAEAKKLIDGGKHTILDVRTKAEFIQGYIANAMNINLYDKQFSELVSGLDKSKPVVVYCAAGGRSAEAKNEMIKLGFKEVINMEGGFEEWREQKLPYVK